MRIHNWCLCQQDNIASIKILRSLQNSDSSWTVYPTSLEIFHWFGPDFHLFSCIYFKPVFGSVFRLQGDRWALHCTVSKGNGDFYRPQRSCGQGYVFARVCDSVNGGVCLSACRDTTPPRADTPELTPLRQQTPAYGQWAAGTHSTGMHSFLFNDYLIWSF